MSWLLGLLDVVLVVGFFVDIAAWFNSRLYRAERKRLRQHLANPETRTSVQGGPDEKIKGKDAWLLFLVLTPLLVLLVGLWALFKGWVPL